MAALRYYTTILTLSSGSAFLVFMLNRYLPSRNARNLTRATHGHETSAAVAILNPQKQDLFQHRITMEIPTTRLKPGLDNNEILARFTQGFFGGWIFSPERWVVLLLTDVPSETPGFDNVNLEESPIREVWDLEALSAKAPPPSGSLLFGNFLLAESVSNATTRRETEQPPAKPGPQGPRDFASAEFVAGGSKTFELISSHRFEVAREHDREEKGGRDLVTVTFSHVSCKSVAGRPYSTFFRLLHLVYARLLFANGIRAILETK
ncbi:hypothetical protein INS49_004370 [Diaporthe citri]|uniref:uncharacterized protein n=1 Tax=Diaporthe citri TaxID=83186 RepID=UPI001C7F87FC|nr:uncharacterized protein INS49_004370 [Diaporthe citri]KAG6354353.1 hypothetical protein INS49_004370 [Diaporthe citri]